MLLFSQPLKEGRRGCARSTCLVGFVDLTLLTFCLVVLGVWRKSLTQKRLPTFKGKVAEYAVLTGNWNATFADPGGL